jgi:hypothetical protein
LIATTISNPDRLFGPIGGAGAAVRRIANTGARNGSGIAKP